jgi:hypothetical protein
MTHAALRRLVQTGADERTIQRLLQSNLHLFGEACTPSSIAGEYIAFSEYPIIEGKTDFVVFTDRSRMAIVVIEVKGADFNFLNIDGTVSAPVNEAVRRVRKKFRVIESNHELFRRRFHEVRREVENGKSRYNSHLSPAKRFHVDPNKEVWLRGMVIGGRMGDNYENSKARHSLEREAHRITFESWDSWIENNGKYGEIL